MNLLNKAYPHPVLRPDTNDFTDSAFQVLIDPAVIESDGRQSIEVEVDFLLSNERIRDEIAKGKAAFAVDIECTDTLFRKVLFCEQNETITFSDKELYGRVELTGLVVCKGLIEDFTSDDLNPEFGTQPFILRPGDVLAFGEQEVAFIEFSSLTFESLIRVQTSSEIDTNSYSIVVDGEMITILMGLAFRSMWDELREESKVAPFLAMSVYKDCVLVALHYISSSDEPDNLRWSRALLSKLEGLGFQLPKNAELDDLNQTAQELISHLAVKKVLRDAM